MTFHDWRRARAKTSNLKAEAREAMTYARPHSHGPRVTLPRNQWPGLEGPAMAILENYIDELAQERDTAPDELSRELITFAIDLVAMRAALPE